MEKLAKMHKMVALILLLSLLAVPTVSSAGKVTNTLGRYSVGGAGIGALLGAGGATITYLKSGDSFDFVTGGGLGLLAGAGLGYLLGVIDLMTSSDDTPTSGSSISNEGSEEKSGLHLLPAGTIIGLTPSSIAVSFRF